jgi:hypothetical protein
MNTLQLARGRATNINNKPSLQLAKKIPILTNQFRSVITHTSNTAKLSPFLYRDIGNIGVPAALAACANHGFYGLPAL